MMALPVWLTIGTSCHSVSVIKKIKNNYSTKIGVLVLYLYSKKEEANV